MSETTQEKTTEAELRRLDAEVAVEVMGGKWYSWRTETGYHHANGMPCFATAEYFYTRGEQRPFGQHWEQSEMDPQPDKMPVNTPNYSSDMAAAWKVEEEIQRRGLTTEYATEVYNQCASDCGLSATYRCIHASPELRCKAALACVRGAKGDTP